MKNSFTKLLGVLAFAGSALVSQAVPFANGSFISFSSADANALWAGYNGTGIADYTGVATFGSVEVNVATGSFSPFAAPNATVTMSNGVTNPALDFASPFTNNPLWSVGGFTFNLTSFNPVQRLNIGGPIETLVLSGTGLVTGNGFEGVGNWSWSGEGSGAQAFSFSTVTTIRAPDGGLTIALLGASLIALAGLRRKFQS